MGCKIVDKFRVVTAAVAVMMSWKYSPCPKPVVHIHTAMHWMFMVLGDDG